MRKLMLLIPLAGITFAANAWQDKGTYTQTGPGNSKCDGDVGICMES